MTSTPDDRLLAAHDIALAALAEITPAATVGDAAGYSVEDDGVVSLRFTNNLPGYVGWFWTVSVAVVEDADPTVLELELLPGDDALLAPDWVPWAERLAEYRAAMAAAGEADEDEDDESVELDDDDDDELDDLDADDFDDDGSPHLDSGDLDGVDIDSMDDSESFGEEATNDAVSEEDAESDDED
jgi:hypothetical protein